ncbi:hypothetical protein D3C85_1543090 [compost metagenome]
MQVFKANEQRTFFAKRWKQRGLQFQFLRFISIRIRIQVNQVNVFNRCSSRVIQRDIFQHRCPGFGRNYRLKLVIAGNDGTDRRDLVF